MEVPGDINPPSSANPNQTSPCSVSSDGRPSNTELPPKSYHPLNHSYKMCHWRQVYNVYLKCGHSQALPDEMIQCNKTTCVFSPYHPQSCVPPKCTATCWQYRQFPEQYSPKINRACPACARGGRY
ncbi:hypothetical protein BD779DRAFT_1518926 [Infundibulicybe gibba]|nr:hypothetical protein BD779DRAFT_1518926 [Infundibulicybe gibba]